MIHDEVCHCGLGPEDHYYGGPAEHNYVPVEREAAPLTTDADALLRSVLADPADDAPRLVYADWLDEHGEPDYASFIRVQCRLARLPESPVTIAPGGRRDILEAVAAAVSSVVDPHAAEREALRARERELLDAHGYGWCDGLIGEGWKTAGDEKTGDIVRVHYHRPATSRSDRHWTDSIVYQFRRGMVGTLTCSTADFLNVAATLAATCPVTAVRLADREPMPSMDEVGQCSWAGWPDGSNLEYHAASRVPNEVLRLMPMDNRYDEETIRFFATADAARLALSRACVAFGRRAAGLPPLNPRTPAGVGDA